MEGSKIYPKYYWVNYVVYNIGTFEFEGEFKVSMTNMSGFQIDEARHIISSKTNVPVTNIIIRNWKTIGKYTKI